ncbi:MAG: helix-hairpin-helix domain-containing protein, partial [Ferruginibacter sp.]
MRIIILFGFLFFITVCSQAQVKETPIPSTTEEELENITANNDDVETEDDSYLQEMVQFQRNPINLNTADADDLKELKILSPMQVQNLISYRTILGKFLNIYEIQAVPGWDINTIRKIRPYITVSQDANLFNSIRDRFRGGNRSLLIRATQTLEKSRGYLLDPAVSSSYYPGSQQKLFMRYKYSYKN